MLKNTVIVIEVWIRTTRPGFIGYLTLR